VCSQPGGSTLPPTAQTPRGGGGFASRNGRARRRSRFHPVERGEQRGLLLGRTDADAERVLKLRGGEVANQHARLLPAFLERPEVAARAPREHEIGMAR